MTLSVGTSSPVLAISESLSSFGSCESSLWCSLLAARSTETSIMREGSGRSGQEGKTLFEHVGGHTFFTLGPSGGEGYVSS